MLQFLQPLLLELLLSIRQGEFSLDVLREFAQHRVVDIR